MKIKVAFQKESNRSWPVKIRFVDPNPPAAIHPRVLRKSERSSPEHALAVLFSSATDDWSTPQWLFDSLDSEFHFTLDPCATETNAKCKTFFTRGQNGLLQDWGRHRVFMNPPYGREIGMWMQKAHDASKAGATVVALVPARPDTRWWFRFVVGHANEIRFLKGRIKFGNGSHGAPFPSSLVVYRPSKNLR